LCLIALDKLLERIVLCDRSQQYPWHQGSAY